MVCIDLTMKKRERKLVWYEIYKKQNVDFLREAVSPRESDVCERDEQVRSTLCPNIGKISYTISSVFFIMFLNGL